MNSLAAIIRQEIASAGPISFARFMALALYHPVHGYYEREGEPIGRRGDFYTSVSVGGLFGELLAFQFAEWLQPGDAAGKTNCPAACGELPPCQIVEAGAHDGQLALDVLTFLAVQRPALLARLEYWVIEPSARRRQRQQVTLQRFAPKVRWFRAWEDLPAEGVRGVVFCNELLDAMPAMRLGWDATARNWFEWGVAAEGEGFIWCRLGKKPSAEAVPGSGLLNLPVALQEVLPDAFTVEVCPAAVDWWHQAAQALRHGRLLTLDYGIEEEHILRPERAQGTLRAYVGHRVHSDLLANPGRQDLTAQVNFTAIRRAGEAAGLTTNALVSQERFLTGIAKKFWGQTGNLSEWTPGQTRQFRTLTHPQQMGRAFHVLVQSRSASGAT